MKKGAVFVFALLAASIYPGFEMPVSTQPEASVRIFDELRPAKFRASAFGVSPRVSTLAPARPEIWNKSSKLGSADLAARSVPNRTTFRKQKPGAGHDTAQIFSSSSGIAMPDPLASFEGLSSDDNAAAYGFRILPPDTIGDVGPRHYVQAVNALFRVFDKAGSPLTPPLKISSLFASLATVCSTRDDGDPVVLYDPLADRWFISQYCKASPPFRQMIAVSRTGDPTGDYNVYEFVMPNVKQNDYPKFGIWHDALYMSTDEFFGSEYAGSGVFAFEKEKMIAGDPASGFIYFDLASPTTIRLGGLLPVDLDGLNAPPANAAALFLGYTATEYGDPIDSLRVFEFRPDFEEPSRSTFGEAAESPLETMPFDPTSPEGRMDIEQPAPGERLDSQSDRLMYRAAYRNLGATESVVVNQTVRTTPVGEVYRAGVRVHEIKRSAGGIFSLGEQATIGSAETSRFMGAAAQDHEGNIAVAYNTGNEDKNPSIVYTGRLAGDAPGAFRDETGLIAGTGVQTAFGFRWGDYSGLAADPADGCTFWITNEYYSLESQNRSPFGWLTRIGSFRFPECEDEQTGGIDITVVNDESSVPVAAAKIHVFKNADETTVPFTRISDANGTADTVRTTAGNNRILVSAAGYRTGIFDVPVFVNQSTPLEARLTPAPLIQNRQPDIVSESCIGNRTVEPSETVEIDLPLRNLGQRNAANLLATLTATEDVLNPGPPQVYGLVAPGAPTVSRRFSFTVSSRLRCGDELVLVFELGDGADDLGSLEVTMQTGRPNVALREDFDSVTAPGLPSGWNTSFDGTTENWTTSVDRRSSGANAAFSPAPRTIGVNELVSPPISITTAEAKLSFKNWYELETTFLRNRVYDGAVLEIKIGEGEWEDILEAGGAFLSGGYDGGVIDSCCSNPLEGRRAWSGRSGVDPEPVFIETRAALPAKAAGNVIRLRWRVATDNGTFREGQYIDDVLVTDGYSCDCIAPKSAHAPFDFDGDGKTDRSVFRASDVPGALDFRIEQSSNGAPVGAAWGSMGDVAVNADYDGDGKADYAVFRPSTRTWFIFQSSDSLFRAVDFGLTDDLAAPADFDGDGKRDIAVYRPSTGNWYILRSSDGEVLTIRFGASEDLPVAADYDGDGVDDIALFRPSAGVWYLLRSSDGGFVAVRFGLEGDKPVAGDFDGDRKADFVLYRPTEKHWYLLNSNDGFSAVRFGLETDIPLQADFDGDGKRDIAVYRPESQIWYYIASNGSEVGINIFGNIGDTAIPGIFVR